MMLLAKVALGLGGTLVMASAYTFHEGVIRVDVDEHCAGGEHIHVWVPATIVPLALHLAPRKDMHQVAQQAAPFIPTLRALTKELEKYPDVNFVEVEEPGQYVRIQKHKGKLQIDVHDSEDNVHIVCPLVVIQDLADQLESHQPAS
jgi:hypothetical protein